WAAPCGNRKGAVTIPGLQSVVMRGGCAVALAKLAGGVRCAHGALQGRRKQTGRAAATMPFSWQVFRRKQLPDRSLQDIGGAFNVGPVRMLLGTMAAAAGRRNEQHAG